MRPESRAGAEHRSRRPSLKRRHGLRERRSSRRRARSPARSPAARPHGRRAAPSTKSCSRTTSSRATCGSPSGRRWSASIAIATSRSCQAALVVAGTKRQAGIQHALGRARVRLEPLPRRRRWLLRIYRGGRSQTEAQGLLAIPAGDAISPSPGCCVSKPGGRGSLHDVDGAARRGYRRLSQSGVGS